MAETMPDKVRVTFVLPSFAGGGAERVVLTLIRHLDRGRFAPRLVVLSGEGPLRDSLPDGLAVTDLRRRRLRQAWFRLPAALGATDPDVIVPTISHINLAVLMIRGRLPPGVRIVARESNTPSASLGATRWPGLFRALYRRYCRRADAILCPSRRVAAEFTTQFGVDPRRLEVMPHPVDVTSVRRLADPPNRHPGPGRRLVAAGRLTRQKGFDRLIGLLPDLPPDTHVTVLGEGEDRAALLRQAESLGVSDRLELPGYVPNPWTHFAGADAFLLPSRWEGMPNAALEALAVGTPVVARTEAGGVTEIGAVEGALAIADDDDAFAAAVRRVVARDEIVLRPSLLPERFALPTVMAAFQALLVRVAAGGRPNG